MREVCSIIGGSKFKPTTSNNLYYKDNTLSKLKKEMKSIFIPQEQTVHHGLLLMPNALQWS